MRELAPKDVRGGSVEVDAVPPDQLRALVRQSIERHVDRYRLNVLQVAERSEREILSRLHRHLREEEDDF